MSDQSRSRHVLELAKELLDDIELSRAAPESLILKGSRLARWIGSDEIRGWLKLEMSGYYSDAPYSVKYMGITGRWTNVEKKLGHWGPLAQIEAAILAEKAKLSSLRTPDSSSNVALLAVRSVTEAMTASANYIAALSGIKSRVLARLHTFAAEVYYKKAFEGLAESIFERYKADVDALIGEHCGDVLEKIPLVMDRLVDGDTESISQALTTCRRIIDSFADSIYPPTDQTIEMGGNTVSLDASKHQNRINAFVQERVTSTSRRQRIRRNLEALYGRVSHAVHNDGTAEEARALFLNTYLFLGEILHLKNPDPPQ